MELALELIKSAKEQQSKTLNLEKCSLTALPDELFELTWLEELNLSFKYSPWDETGKELIEISPNQGEPNKISELPAAFSKLQNLKFFNARGNPISDLSPLSRLTRLTQTP